MADRTSVRSSNRRNTPQSPPKPGLSTSPQRRIIRSTRSQSYDISDSEAGRTGKKGGRRGARQASVESVQSTESRGSQAGKSTRRAARARPAHDLSTVAEDPDLIYPELEEADNEGEDMDNDAGVQIQLRRETKSPGAVSAISGTTARTSHSAQELADLDPESMLDALPDLLGAATKILNLLAPQNALPAYIIGHAKDLQDTSSRASKNLHRLERTFRLQRDLYGSEQYINTTIALRALLRVRHVNEVGSGPWRPDGVLQMANLTTLAITILPAHRQDPSAQHAIEKLERDFPTPFLFETEGSQTGSIAPMGSSGLLETTFAMALEVRTQFFIMLLSRYMDQPNFDPDIVLEQVFFESKNAVKGWDNPGFRGEELSKRQVELILQRVQHIRHMFPEDSQALGSGQFVDLERLGATFSWSAFITSIASWCRLRQDEIEAQFEWQGGLENIVQALGDEIKRRVSFETQGEVTDGDARSPLVQLHYEPPSEISQATSDQNETSRRVPPSASKSKPRLSFKSPSAIAHLKQRFESKAKPAMQQQPPQVVANRPVASTQPHTPGNRPTTSHVPSTAPAKITNDMQARVQIDDEWRPRDFDDVGEELLLDADPYAEQRLQLANRQRFDLENNKENIDQRPSATMRANKKPSFIDRQPNAERVSFDDSQHSSQQPLPAHEGIKRSRRQVGTMENVLEEGEDQGEISDLSEDVGFEKDSRVPDIQRRRNAASTGKRRAPVAAVRSPAKRVRQSHPVNEDEDEEEEIRAAVEQHNQANAPRPSQVQSYKRTNIQSRFISASQPKKVQSRNAWSAEEIETLIAYIETIGTSWAIIKKTDAKEGGILELRDQVALKDKARNMKMDFLKVGDFMPRHFERIALSKLQIDKLRGVNILYNERTGRRRYAEGDGDMSDEE